MFRNIFGGNSGSGRGNDFVGQYVELGQHKLRIKRVLGEGGYGFVFAAQDTSSGKEYALKRLMAPDDTIKQEIMQEVSYLKKLKGHKNIIKFVAVASSGNDQMSHGMTEFLILTELCSGGQLINLLLERHPTPLALPELLKVFAQTCMAVAHMHKQPQPIIHRDLKIENLLFSARGMMKLCDFGSSTTDMLYPDSSWTALQRNLAEDEIQKNTTPMYRAPEMVDLYSNHPITTKADVWALGCILYYLCYMEHPFADSAKLKILNAKYTIPEDPRKVSDLQPLIDMMLQTNPEERPSVDDIIFQLESVAESLGINLNSPVLVSSLRSCKERCLIEQKVLNTPLKNSVTFDKNVKIISVT
ncbi:cyclin-G-associated kinase-like [Rhopilema esculentum]|uniref:cyclin-G-associated kinase-like n=1 Tax=Rhopilema esculentum TaxID=499914 RepID=UPI0031DAB5BD